MSESIHFGGRPACNLTWRQAAGTRPRGSDPISFCRRLRFETLEDRRLLAVFTVSNINDAGAGSLRQAILDANGATGADTIAFTSAAAGTIALTSGEMQITGPLTINGPGQDVLTINAQQLSRVFNFSGFFGDLSVSGLTLQGGKALGSGGAIRFNSNTGSLSVSGSTIIGNSVFDDNISVFTSEGGGIFSNGNVSLSSSTVSGNSAAGGFGLGGGVFTHGNLIIMQSTVSGNDSADHAGGIYAGGTITLTNSDVHDNHALSGFGGGIVGSAQVTLNNSSVWNNSSKRNGGGMFGLGDADFTLSNSTVSGNSANENGGGIASEGSITLTNSTIANNHATGALSMGGGVWSYQTTLTLLNSIVAGNSAVADSPDISPDGSTITINYSLVGDTSGTEISSGSGAGNLLNINPVLGSLANNGGTTLTHALLPGSPAIDAGDPMAGNAPPYDQRGMPFNRVVGGGIDIGAFEFQQVSAASFGDYNGDGLANIADYIVWRNTFGMIGIPAFSGADGDGDGTIDQDDYGVWRAHFGQTVPAAGAGAESSVEDGVGRGEGASETTVASASGGGEFRATPLLATASPRAEAEVMLVRLDSAHWVSPRQDAAAMWRASRRDDALVAWLAGRAREANSHGSGDPDRFDNDDHVDDSADAFCEAVDAVFERVLVTI